MAPVPRCTAVIGVPRGGRDVHDVADPPQVLVEDLLRVREVHVRLLCPVQAQHPAALDEPVRNHLGVHSGRLQVPAHAPHPPGLFVARRVSAVRVS